MALYYACIDFRFLINKLSGVQKLLLVNSIAKLIFVIKIFKGLSYILFYSSILIAETLLLFSTKFFRR